MQRGKVNIVIDGQWVWPWLAGLIDGEGSVMLVRHRRDLGRKCGYRPRVAVYNTSLKLINKLIEVFGGNVYVRRKPGPRKPVYEWRCKTSKVPEILNGVLSFLVIKDRKAVRVMEAANLIKLRVPTRGTQSSTVHTTRLEQLVGEVQDAKG